MTSSPGPVPQQPYDGGASFDLVGTERKVVYRSAKVAVVTGALGAYVIVAITLVSLSVIGKILIIALMVPLVVVSVALLIGSNALRRAGADVLTIDATGLVRTSKVQGFAVEWDEIARIDVVAAQAIAGYNPTMPGNTRDRALGGQTALRIQPADPARFAAMHPTLDTRTTGPVVAQLVAAPFGTAFTMPEPTRSGLVSAVAHWGGFRFGGRMDETARARLQHGLLPGPPPDVRQQQGGWQRQGGSQQQGAARPPGDGQPGVDPDATA